MTDNIIVLTDVIVAVSDNLGRPISQLDANVFAHQLLELLAVVGYELVGTEEER